jgi:hypothetical protein
LIDDEKHGAFAFFAENSNMRFSKACGCLPVDGADVVAGVVVSQFFEGEASATEAGCVATSEE